MESRRYQDGLAVFEKMTGKDGIVILEHIRELYPDMAHLIVTNAFGDIYTRPGLDLKQREIVTLSSLITQGAMDQLPVHVSAALNVGLTPKEIVEIVIQCTVYAGFPKALSALHIVMDVCKEHSICIEM
ncbi:carboxymuconolactone decarboxylase family protein [Aneurinibacillus uraniidurans]|uniref:carboxymuconolactone decarboxylase family protein n=1 Tax=Aneurinibacillus uraniidurans TaxID=2966586 RepID=UPI00234AAAA3|nr:carboxymuconolactone decarboxylase family protein [Aneurinibacillus sp. B1]WCN37294.1 carboxymuconolactone decarboxylase family protein [Aneurinibacillus sp. B1]